MLLTNPSNTKAAQTIEKRMINAITNNNSTTVLISEIETLYKSGYLNDNEFSFLSDVEAMKEIFS